MNTQANKFEKMRNAVKVTLTGALILCLIALIIVWAAGSNEAVVEKVTPICDTIVIIAVVLIAIGILVCLTALKCPYCNKHIIRNVLKVEACPHCNRNLVTGLKSKKNTKHHRLF